MITYNTSRGRKRIPGLVDEKASYHLPVTYDLVLRLSGDSGLFTDVGKTIPAQNDNDLIYTWADISGNGRDYTQSTESARPVYIKNKVGYHDAVRFVSSDFLYRAEAVVGVSACTVFVVVYLSSTSQKGGIFGVGNNDGNGWYLGVGSNYFENAGNNFLIVHQGVGWAPHGDIGTGVHLLTAKYVNSKPYMYIDGKRERAPSINAPYNPQPASYIGWAHNNGYRYYNDYILEIIAYSTSLTDIDRMAIERYLKQKFNIV